MSHKAWGWCRLGWNLPIRKIASRKDAVGFTPGMRDEGLGERDGFGESCESSP